MYRPLIAVDGDKSVWVVDNGNNRVVRRILNPTGSDLDAIALTQLLDDATDTLLDPIDIDF